MAKGKTQFDFVVNAPFQVINNTIQNYLVANKFQPIEGVVWGQQGSYLFNDPLVEGKRGFDYVVQGNRVTIWAYVGSPNKPMPLDDSLVGAMPKQRYKSLLVPLFNELEKLNNTTTYNNGNIQPNRPVCNSGVPVQPVIHQPVQQTSVHQAPMQNRPANSIPSGYQQPKPQPQAPYVATQQQANPYQQNNFSTNQFIDDINKKGEKMAVASLIISIVGLLLSCFGVLPGGILILLNYWFASQGLKTKKKGISITAIVLTSLSLLLLIVSLIIKVANL